MFRGTERVTSLALRSKTRSDRRCRRSSRHSGDSIRCARIVRVRLAQVGKMTCKEGRLIPEFSRNLQESLQDIARRLVRKEGLEPSRCYPQVPETCASTSSATFAGGRRIAAQPEGVKESVGSSLNRRRVLRRWRRLRA